MPVLALSTGLSSWDSPWIVAVGGAQLGLYGGALLSALIRPLGVRVPALGLLSFFVAVNAAYLVALVRTLQGRRVVEWRPERSDTSRRSEIGT